MRVLKLSALALISATTLRAQEPAKSMFGLGVTFNPGALTIPGESNVLLTQSGFNNVLVPIRTRSVTIEPEFGLLRSTTEREVQTGPTTFTKIKTTASFKRIGAGLLKHLERRENLEPYIAPRLGFIFASAEEPSGPSTTVKMTSTNFYGTAAAGGQYFFTSHFTMGGEAQFTYTKLGKPKVTGTTFGSPGESGSVFSTLGLVTLRWYY